MKMKRLKSALQKVPKHNLAQLVNAGVLRAERKMERKVLRARPENIDIAVSKACNLKCTMCRDYETPGAQTLTLEAFEKIAPQVLPTARRLSICSGGEPYLNRNLIDFLRIAKGYKVDTWVLSNGMIYKDKWARAIVDEQLIDKHGFSVDGIRPQTLAWVRENAELPVIQRNIKALAKFRRIRGQKPEITIRYAIMRRNIEELPEAIRYWAAAGIEGLECNYLSLANGMDKEESLYFHGDLTRRIFEEARGEARRHPGFNLILPDTVEDLQRAYKGPTPCTEPWSFAWIDSNGRVLPCYRTWGVLEMGQLTGEEAQSFEVIWNNKTYQELRATVNKEGAERLYDYCAKCDYRQGYGALDSHLADEVWLEMIDVDETERARIVEHRLR